MKLNSNSIGIKLWKYFVMFALITLILLWILQTVLLQGFYNILQKRNVEKIANIIAENIAENENLSFIDNIAYENSMQIIITDINENILHSVDEYSSMYQKNKNPYVEEKMNWQIGMYKNLPDEYSDFLKELKESNKGSIVYELKNDEINSNMIYGKLVNFGGREIVIYINTPIGAVQSTVSILKSILLMVTVILLFVGFLLAYIFSKRFYKPISNIALQAQEIAKGNENIEFEKGFCSELDELSENLSETAKSIANLESYRKKLLANITHDLKTPLTLISGYAEKIEDLSWDNREEAKNDAIIIKREAKRLSLLVNDILDYSILESGNIAFDFKKINISKLAENILIQLDGLFKSKNIVLERKIEKDLYVLADEKRLYQVFYNLIANAINHIGSDNIIGIVLYKKENCVRAEIYEHGVGIAEKDMPYIWNRYFTSRERSRSETGTGLGLSIVREILNAHKGKYGVNSQEGKGSCFWFEINL